jgi:glycerol-3-phosphate dehydrogenase
MIDIIIIGGGIVGASMAYELAKYQLNVTLLEKETELSFGVSKSNSGIIHTGFQDDYNSLKGKLAVRGNFLYRKISSLLDFPFIPTGELVVAFPGQTESIEKIKENGERLGIPGLEIVDAKWLRKNEPMLSKEIEYALLGPSAAVINPWEVIYAMAENAISNGVKIYCDNEVHSITRMSSSWRVKTLQAEFESHYVINAAGLSADTISFMAGLKSPRIIPYKGEEFILDRHADRLTRRIVFPVPKNHTKGILIIPTVDGNTMIGPTSNEVSDKEDITTTKKHKDEVLKAARKLAPSINERLLIASFAGLRPTTKEGDFYIKEEQNGFINIVGIKSPGLTAAPAIAEYVVNILAKNMRLTKKKIYNPKRKSIPRFRLLNTKERNTLIKKDADFGEVICRCELVTKGEIKEAIRRGARTLDGIKFRTRSQMGRCHGAFCTSKIMAIMSEELNIPFDEITKRGKGSELIKGNGF